MKQIKIKYSFIFQLLLILCLMFSGCGNKEDSTATKIPSQNSTSSDSSTAAQTSTEKGSRDNTSVILIPEASGITVHSCEVASIDVSNSTEGYLMANYTGTVEKVKLQITGPDKVTYTYDLHGNGYETFPLTAGDGTYTVGVYENISDTNYSVAFSADINVSITNSFGPYLYPNQYVNFNENSLPIAKAVDLAYPANSDLEVVEQVYNYIIENFTYDYDKAASVVSGYLPAVDEVYNANSGICFDYAAVMATMLRSQGIPTRLEVGYMGEQYHAWISIYIEDIGWINGVIEFNGTAWNLLDPTNASVSKEPRNFLSENSKYTTKYVY